MRSQNGNHRNVAAQDSNMDRRTSAESWVTGEKITPNFGIFSAGKHCPLPQFFRAHVLHQKCYQIDVAIERSQM